MKKVLVGCLLILVFGMFATCAGGYFFVWRPISGFVAEGNSFMNFEARLVNQAAYNGPEDYKLSPEQVERFVAVNRAVSASLGENVDALRQVLDQRTQDVQEIREILSAFGELKRILGIAVAARDVQVDALNTANMSVHEYRWIRDRFLSALAPGVDLSQLQNSFQNGNFQIPNIPGMPNVPGLPQPATGTPTGTEAEKNDANKQTGAKPGDAPGGKIDAPVAPAAAAPATPAPTALPTAPTTQEAPAAAPTPGVPNVDVLAQLPGGREAYDHNRALIEPYREEAMGWIRNWAASF